VIIISIMGYFYIGGGVLIGFWGGFGIINQIAYCNWLVILICFVYLINEEDF
jgi:hypothetical protein